MNRKTQPLTRERRRVLLLLHADRWPAAPTLAAREFAARQLALPMEV